jgi:lysophospholipase L1-like esterase
MKKKYFILLILAALIVATTVQLVRMNDRFRGKPMQAFLELSAIYKHLPDIIQRRSLLHTVYSNYVAGLVELNEPSDVMEAKKMNSSSPRYRVVAFGDSTTAPSNISSRLQWWTTIFADLMSAELKGIPVEIVNAGIPGTSSIHGLRRLRRDVIELKPDLVLLSFGLNDGQLLYFNDQTLRPFVTFEQFHGAMKDIVETVEKEIGCPVILWTMPRVGSGYASERGKQAQAAQKNAHARMRQIIREVASETAQSLADVYDAMENSDWPDTLTDKDEYHPAPTAQPLIARTILKTWKDKILPAMEKDRPEEPK